MAGVRIAGLEEVMTLNENMVLATDGPDGTKKINANSMMEQYANSSQMINNPLAVVGSAQQLIGDTGTEDTTPYLYRKTPYASDRAYLRKLVGGSVVWNQLVTNGNFASTSGWTDSGVTSSANDNIMSLTSTASGDYYSKQTVSLIAGHKYIFIGSAKSPQANTRVFTNFYGTSDNYSTHDAPDTNWHTYTSIHQCNSTDITQVRLCNRLNNDTIEFKNVMLINLTAMFGSEIADYIYTLEQSQAGSGIAYLKSYGFLTEDYYATDSGSIQSVSVSEKKVVGFNQWDEVWELGDIAYSTGGNYNDQTRIRSKNYIPVLENTTYYFRRVGTERVDVFLYDANKTYLGRYDGGLIGAVTGLFTVSPGAHFMRFTKSETTTYNNDICINLSKPTGSPKNGGYLPYTTTTYNLPHDTLRGIIKKDASNRLYYDGDERYPGKKIQRYGIVDLGTLTWELVSTSGSNYRFKANLYGVKIPSEQSSVPKIKCSKYMTGSPVSTYLGFTGISINNQGEQVVVCDMSYSDAETFKIAMSGVMLVYELATPIVTEETAYQSLQIVDGDGTEEMIDYLIEQGDRDVAIPVGHETTYLPDLRKKLEDLPQIPPAPTTDGTYTLTATVSGGTATYNWE